MLARTSDSLKKQPEFQNLSDTGIIVTVTDTEFTIKQKAKLMACPHMYSLSAS